MRATFESGTRIVAVASITACLLAPSLSHAQSAPALSQRAVEALLPKYCRYEIDLRGMANPNESIGRLVGERAVTCPFIAGSATTAITYIPRQRASCSVADRPGLPILRAMEISGRTARKERECSAGSRAGPPPAQVLRGDAYFVQYGSKGFGLDSTFWIPDFVARTGAPIADANVGSVFSGSADLSRIDSARSQAIGCILMMPGAKIDPISYFRLAGRPLPADAKEEKLVYEDCKSFVKKRYGLELAEGQTASEFSVWLHHSSTTPDSASFPELVRALLQQTNVKRVRADQSGSSNWVMNREIVVKASDGTPMAIIGGNRQTMFSLRALSPGVCEAVFALANGAHLFIETGQGNVIALKPPSVTGRYGDLDYAQIPVANAADVCALLRPGFEEWQSEAPSRPADLHDLDGQNNSLNDE